MSDNPKPKLLARTAKGFQDRGPADIAASERMLKVIRETFELYGFEPVETPFIEYTDALGKFLPDQDRPNEGVFSFQDEDEQWLSLRYDLTAPLARHVAENYDKLPKPFRSYRSGFVFRNEKPGPGRFRQFMQFDADIVGAPTVAADAEICMLAADTMERLGIARGQYVVKINNRKVLDGVMEAIGLGGEDKAAQRLTVLRAIDKLDKFGPEGVRLLLGAGRWDGGEVGKGDFTKGAGLSDQQIDRIFDLLQRMNFDTYKLIEDPPNGKLIAHIGEGGLVSTFGTVTIEGTDEGSAIAQRLADHFPDSPLAQEGAQELEQISRLVESAGYGPDRIRIDPSVVRGLEYYTGPVYEVELTFPVTNDDGQVVRFGSVAGGGRYDGLVGRFRPEPVPATGFSIGVSRLYAALKAVGSPLVEAKPELPLVVVTAMDNKTQDGKESPHMASYQALVSRLRAMKSEVVNEGGVKEDKPVLRADLYLGSSGFNAQMKYADRRGAACVIIQGSSEREAGTVVIKDLILGAELAAMGREGRDREDYLERQAQAQVTVPLDQMEAKLLEMLARHR